MVDEIHGRPGTAGAFEAWVRTLPNPPDSFWLANIYTGLGKRTSHSRTWKRAYGEHRALQAMTFWGIDPFFATLYSDPRFDAFLRHAGLPLLV